MTIEFINENNISALTTLYVEMFPEVDYNVELNAFKNVLHSDTETCFLVKLENQYVAFIHLGIRTDYVEGSETTPTTYIEAMYVKNAFRRKGIAKLLLGKAEEWTINNNLTELASDSEINNSESINFHIGSGFEEANRIVCFIKKIRK